MDTDIHYMKSVRIRSCSGPHFPAFGLNTERYFLSPIFVYSVRMRENMDQNNSKYGQFFAVIISIHQNIYSVSVTDHPMSFKHWGGFTISRELILKMNASSWHLLPYFYPFPKVDECYTNVRWIVTFWVIFADNLRVTTSVFQIQANDIINMSGIGWFRPNKSHKFQKINLSDITRCYLLKIYFSTYLFYN